MQSFVQTTHPTNDAPRKPGTRALVISLLVIILLAAGSLAAILLASLPKDRDCVAYIYQSGVLIKTIDLNAVTEPYTITLTDADGGTNTIEVRQGSIGIASCPDQICVHTGFITDGSIPIVCLPHELTIEIKASTEDAYDSVAK